MDPNIIEFEKQKDLCTFKPKLYKPMYKKSPRVTQKENHSISLSITPRAN